MSDTVRFLSDRDEDKVRSLAQSLALAIAHPPDYETMNGIDARLQKSEKLRNLVSYAIKDMHNLQDEYAIVNGILYGF